MKLGIAIKINLLAMGVAIMATFLTAFVIYQGNYQMMVDHKVEGYADEIAQEKTIIQQDISTIKQELDFLANLPPIDGIIRARENNGFDEKGLSTEAQWKDRLEVIFKNIVRVRKNYFQLRYIKADGNEIVRIEKKGDEVVTGDLQNKSQEEYFKKSIKLAEGEVYISKITLNREHGTVVKPITYVSRFSTPIYNSDNKLFGIVVVNINFNSILKTLGSSTNNDKIFITDHKGNILADQGSGYDHHDLIHEEHNHSLFLPDNYPVLEKEFNDKLHSGSNTNLKEYNLYWHGDESIIFFKIYIDKVNNNFLTVSLINNKDSIFSTLTDLKINTIYLLMVLMVISGFIALILSRSISKPITQITTFVRKLGRDIESESESESEKLPEILSERNDEIGIMAGILDQTLNKFHEKNIKIKSILENAVDGVVIIDKKGAVQTFNKAAEDIFGYRKKEVVGKNVSMLMPEPDKAQHDGYLKNYLKTGEKKIIGSGRTVEGRRKDGSTFPMDLAVSEIKLKNETVFLGAVRDVTERQKSEEKNIQFSNILRSSVNEIYIFEIKTLKFLFVNDGALKNIGYKEEEIKKLTPVDIKPGLTKDEFLKKIKPLMEEKIDKFTFNAIHQRKDRSTYPVYITLQKTIYESKPAFVAIIIDITEQEQYKKDIENLLYGMSSSSNIDFFKNAALSVQNIVGGDYTLISKSNNLSNPTSVTTIVALHDKEPIDNIKYDLQDTPCNEAIGGEFCMYENNIQQKFPNDKILQDIR